MAVKTKTFDITITDDKGTFATLFRKITGESEYDFEGLSALRRILSNEKLRLLHIIKTRSPRSLYQLAKYAGRDFKSVADDTKLLERFGFIDFTAEKTGLRQRLKPVIISDAVTITLRV